jgi:hypothetical protein
MGESRKMDDSTTVASAQVPKQKQEEWSNYVEDNPHVSSMSYLLRMAVQKDVHDNESNGGEVGDEVAQRLTAASAVSRSTLGA